jgi:hypothetical protein
MRLVHAALIGIVICTSCNAVSDGTTVTGNGGQILNNEIGGGSIGISVSGSAWHVEGNNVFGTAVGIGDSVRLQGTHNVVVRNSETQIGTIFVIGANNFAPEEAAPTVTSPLSNVIY